MPPEETYAVLDSSGRGPRPQVPRQSSRSAGFRDKQSSIPSRTIEFSIKIPVPHHRRAVVGCLVVWRWMIRKMPHTLAVPWSEPYEIELGTVRHSVTDG